MSCRLESGQKPQPCLFLHQTFPRTSQCMDGSEDTSLRMYSSFQRRMEQHHCCARRCWQCRCWQSCSCRRTQAQFSPVVWRVRMGVIPSLLFLSPSQRTTHLVHRRSVSRCSIVPASDVLSPIRADHLTTRSLPAHGLHHLPDSHRVKTERLVSSLPHSSDSRPRSSANG